jgi:hypothetical protein
MPLATTFAGDSARAEGLFSSIVSLGASYWVGLIGYSNFVGVARSTTVDSSGNVYICGYDGSFNTSGNQVIVKYNSAGTVLWKYGLINTTGAGYGVQAFGISVDSSGNVYVCGAAATNYSSTTFIQSISKYDSDGTIQWQRTLTDDNGVIGKAYSVDVDSSGNVYVCGHGTISSKISVTKWSSSGGLLWQRTLTDDSKFANDLAYSVRVDGSGNLYVCGTGYLPYGGSYYQGQSISKWDTSGNFVWVRSLADAGTSSAFNAFAYGIDFDSSGNVYVCGEGKNSSDKQVQSISKWNSSGTIQWQRTLTDVYSTPNTVAQSIKVDNSGNVYVCGYGLNSSNQSVQSISKWDTSGTIQWQRTLTDNYAYGQASAYGIAVDNAGAIYVCGNMKNASNYQYASIAKLPADGSRTGYYTGSTVAVVYASSSWTAATSTWAASTPAWTNATSTWTNATSSYVSSVWPATSEIVNL